MDIIDLAEKEKITFGTLGQRKNPIIICDIDRQIENTSLGFFDNHAGGALHKAWKGYVIAKKKDEYDNMEHYARIIQENQHDLTTN